MVDIPDKPERPIETKSDDSLNRGEFIGRLSKSLVTSRGISTGIVVGLTGSWGSGKSSLLNLLREHLKLQYPEILIVNFDPWLVSGRDDLITQFLAQVIGTINSEPKLHDKLKSISKTLAKYGSQLSPIVNVVKPGLGTILRSSFAVVEQALSGTKDLFRLRKDLEAELEKAGLPIVVMIDELDRVEDQEVRAVAQLVRAVADFRSISYILAFDAERVTDALGGAGDKTERAERGKAYLEKIVQLQIPVPIMLEEEILKLIESSLLPILVELGAPKDALSNERYREVASALTSGVISTPRDVKRLIGTFHAIVGMVFGEVDWIDVFVYCALLVKAPASVDLLRKNYQVIVQGQISDVSATKRMALDQDKLDQRLTYLLQNRLDDSLARLLGLIFPFASENPRDSFDHQDSISTRRPLLTMLRLALPSSTLPRKEIEGIVRQGPELEGSLRRIYDGGYFDDFFDRFSTIYLSSESLDELQFWTAVSNFLRKSGLSWIDRYNPMHEVVRNFADLFETKIRRSVGFKRSAETIFHHFVEINERELMPSWLRTHVFIYQLFGHQDRSSSQALISPKETADLVQSLGLVWRTEHLNAQLLQSRWSLQPVYTMIDSGSWAADCKNLLQTWMTDDIVVDAISLFLFGAYYSTGQDTVEAFCGWDFLLRRAKERLSSSRQMHDTVRVSLKKAVGDRS